MLSNPEIEKLIRVLRQALLRERLAHAYLLCGRSTSCSGSRRRDTGAAVLQSAARTSLRNLLGCRQAAEHRHPDLLWIEPESKSRRVVVDQIDQALRHISQTTFDGGWKTVALADADRMNDQASNKILKTLEEPPPRSLFLLLTESPDELLPTIISRCQRLTLNADDPAESREGRELVLATMTATSDVGVTAAIERARFLLERLKAIKAEVAQAEQEAMKETNLDDLDKSARDKLKAVLDARVEARYRRRRETVLEWLLLWQRDLLLCVAGADDTLLAFGEAADTLRREARGLDCRTALAQVRAVEAMQTQFNRNVHESMVFEHGFIQLAHQKPAFDKRISRVRGSPFTGRIAG